MIYEDGIIVTSERPLFKNQAWRRSSVSPDDLPSLRFCWSEKRVGRIKLVEHYHGRPGERVAGNELTEKVHAKDRDVAKAFLTERSLLIPDRPRQLEVLLRVLRLSCPHIRRILDVGTGDGILLATVLEAFPEASGVGVDFSPLMLEQARLRLAKFGPRLLHGSGTVEADLQPTTWKDTLAGPFDAIISGFAIHHLPHERKRSLYQARVAILLRHEHMAATGSLPPFYVE